jgi:hypothetical protein
LPRIEEKVASMSRSAPALCILFSAVGIVAGLSSLPSACVVAAEAAKLTVVTAEPPQEVAAPIRAVLDQKSLQLTDGEAPFFEFWFRKELPLAKQPENGSLTLETIQEGAVLGVVKVNVKRYDFRDEELPPGVYVMRYGIQPEDGNHQGVAPTRTFALLIDAKSDTKLEAVPHEELVKQAATINAAKHPTNLNLQLFENPEGALPRLDERNDGEHKVLLLKLPARVGEAREATTLALALVYEGIGKF